MLASINSNNAKAMADMLRRALAKWNSMSESERMLSGNPADQKSSIRRAEDRFPVDGLAVRVFSRDLPRDNQVSGWRANAWNQSYAWFTKDEARSMLPASPTKGARQPMPEALAKRLIALNFIDNVRGQTMAYDPSHVSVAKIETEITAVSGGVATLQITGESKADREGTWAIAGFQDMDKPTFNKFGVRLQLLGTGRFDFTKGMFTQFDVVAIGTRYGGTQYNQRQDDMKPGPIGFYVTKTGDNPAERVAPEHIWRYGWR